MSVGGATLSCMIDITEYAGLLKLWTRAGAALDHGTPADAVNDIDLRREWDSATLEARAAALLLAAWETRTRTPAPDDTSARSYGAELHAAARLHDDTQPFSSTEFLGPHWPTTPPDTTAGRLSVTLATDPSHTGLRTLLLLIPTDKQRQQP